jgi:hypothetical protein
MSSVSNALTPPYYPLYRNVRNTDTSILPALYKKHLAHYPNITDLDELSDGSLLGSSQGREKLSLAEMDRRLWIVDKALDVAKVSVDGCATILTIPIHWNFQEFSNGCNAATTKARINTMKMLFFAFSGFSPSGPKVLERVTAKETRTFVISDDVVTGSSEKSAEDSKKLLKNRDFNGEFPSGEEILTAIFMTYIAYRGERVLYPSRTRTQLAAENGGCFGIASYKDYTTFCEWPDNEACGVGASISFKMLPKPLPEEDIET